MALFGKTKDRMKLSKQQRLAGVAMALLLIIQTPTYSFKVEFSDDSVRTVHMGPLETLMLAVLRTHPEITHEVTYLLVPGAWFKTIAANVDACWVNTEFLVPCDWSALWDLRALHAKADITDK
ncbi:hypothetical protein TSOC_010769, partial [Tetrabaena socialis]